MFFFVFRNKTIKEEDKIKSILTSSAPDIKLFAFDTDKAGQEKTLK